MPDGSPDRKGAAVPTLSRDALTHQIDRFLASQTLGGIPDEQLIERFTQTGDQHAFAVLMQRYGGLVLNVGRRVLRSSQDAEDVFQATFLLLARKAGTIRKRQSLVSWLYGVAYR